MPGRVTNKSNRSHPPQRLEVLETLRMIDEVGIVYHPGTNQTLCMCTYDDAYTHVLHIDINRRGSTLNGNGSIRLSHLITTNPASLALHYLHRVALDRSTRICGDLKEGQGKGVTEERSATRGSRIILSDLHPLTPTKAPMGSNCLFSSRLPFD